MAQQDTGLTQAPQHHPRKPRKLLYRTGIILLETVAVIGLLFVGAAGFMVFRLMSGPMDVGFAKSYLQEVLRVPERGLTPTVEDIVLSWPDLNGPLLLGFKKAKLFNAQGQAIIAVDEAALSLSKVRLLIGQVSPVALIMREPVVQVVRTKSGKIVFGLVGMEAEPDSYGPHSVDEKSALERILRYIARPGRERSGLGTLEAFKVENAKVVVEDKTLNSSWVLPRMNASFESKDEGLNIDFDLQFSATDPDTSYLRGNIKMPWETQQLEMRAELKSFDPWFFAQKIPTLSQFQKGDAFFDGQFAAILDKDLKPLKLLAEVSSPGGKFLSTQISPEPISFGALSLRARYDNDQDKLVLEESTVTVKGVAIRARAALAASEGKIEGPVRLEIEKMAQKDIGPLWPPALKGDNAENWIVHKLSEGTFKDLYADIFIAGYKTNETGWAFEVPNVIAGFNFEGMKVDYRPPMFPVTKGKGKGTFNLKEQKLVIDVESGKISDLDVTGGHLEFVNIIEKGKGQANLDIDLQGPLATGLKYVMTEPIEMKTKFDVEKVKGDAKLKVNVKFPTRKDIKVKEVKVAADGTLDNVYLPSVVKDMPVTGGPMRLTVAGNDLVVSGKAALDGRPTDFTYKEFVESAGQKHKFTVAAKLKTDHDMRMKLGVDISDYLEGEALADVTYTELQNGDADVDVKADLTPGRLLVGPFDYVKEPGVAADATLKVAIKSGDVQKITDMNVKAPDLSVKGASLAFVTKGEETQLSAGAFPEFIIGESKGRMDFTVEDSGRYNIKANASFLDLYPFVKSDGGERKPYDNPPMVIEMKAAAMRGADKKDMPQGRFLIDINTDGTYKRLEADASAGDAPVELRLYQDEENRRTFHFMADNAGAALGAFGIYQNIRGGKMNVRGKGAKPGDMNMQGKAEIKDFKVVNAPTLARLISALSLPGLAQLLSGEGLTFSKLEADYTWNSKPNGGLLHIKDGRTSGNSVGFSFDGDINLANYTVNVEGTVVPLSDINKIIGSIPLIGEILTGGSGLIAATYTIKGSTEKPDVFVNPLSVLTPGILRRILFE